MDDIQELNGIKVYNDIKPRYTIEKAKELYKIYPLNPLDPLDDIKTFDLDIIGNCYLISSPVFIPDDLIECKSAYCDYGRILNFKILIPIEHIYLLYCFIDP